MSKYVDVEWSAYWHCPKCDGRCDDLEYNIDFSDPTVKIECFELVDKGGDDLEVCGHKYSIRR